MTDGNTCSVCGHDLAHHIDEKDGWRCHSLDPSAHQCECYLRKNRAGDEGKDFYSLEKRVNSMTNHIKEVKERIKEDDKNDERDISQND